MSATLTDREAGRAQQGHRHRPQDLAERRSRTTSRPRASRDGLSGRFQGKIVVGAANFSENQTLANIYKLALNAAGFQASVKTVGNRELYEPALERGELQVVPEYAATLTEFLNKDQRRERRPEGER